MAKRTTKPTTIRRRRKSRRRPKTKREKVLGGIVIETMSFAFLIFLCVSGRSWLFPKAEFAESKVEARAEGAGIATDQLESRVAQQSQVNSDSDGHVSQNETTSRWTHGPVRQNRPWRVRFSR